MPSVEPSSGVSEVAGARLERARRGDLAAFNELLQEHECRVFSLALRFTGQRADAEELTQDVFVELHRSMARISDDAHLLRWLLRTVAHRCLNRLRDDRRRPRGVAIDSLPTTSQPTSTDADADPLLASRLRNLVLQLSPDARAVVLLRFQEDLDPADIAAVLGIPLNTVKSHLRRSLEWMRAQCAGESHGS